MIFAIKTLTNTPRGYIIPVKRGIMMAHECCERKKVRSPEEYKKLINRLSRIEGQIRGIRGMVESDAYCPDILIQTAAAQSALAAFERELLGNHIRTCVSDDIRAGRYETVDELTETLQKLIR